MSLVGSGYCVTKICIGVLGATSLVGGSLLTLLTKTHINVAAFSRTIKFDDNKSKTESHVAWHQLKQTQGRDSELNLQISNQQEITEWICLLPIWVLPDYFSWLKSLGAKRIVVLSSTSRFTKSKSEDENEIAVVKRLIEGEEQLIQWATEHDIEWVILRPTLIYGGGKDKNISTIVRVIRRFGFFPILGKGQGYRQPIHVDDVAMACYQALNQDSVSNQAYNISGSEKLTYREMVNRVFTALGKKPRLISLPLPVLKVGLAVMKMIPRYRYLTLAMITRMNEDMVFDHDAATRDFGFSPQPFELKGNGLIDQEN